MTKTPKAAVRPQMSMADAIAARKAALISIEPATPSPQTVVDRKHALTLHATRLEGFACDMRVLCDAVGRLKRSDLDALAGAVDRIAGTIKATRKGLG